jgi:hypothetical protein
MVTHTRLQQYKHHYGMVFLTGLFGCRWHRYQQSTDRTEKVSHNVYQCVSVCYVGDWLVQFEICVGRGWPCCSQRGEQSPIILSF